MHTTRVRKLVNSGKILFNILLITGMLLSQVNLVFAQDGETASPTDAPTEAVTVTPEPTDAPTTAPTTEPTAEPTFTPEPMITPEPTITLEPTEALTEEADLAAETTFSWELSFEYAKTFNLIDLKGAALTSLGVVSTIENLTNGKNRVTISGTGSTDLIRQVIYDVLLPEINFLNGYTLISIQTLTMTGSPITINLESQPTTGYTWQINAPGTSVFSLAGTSTANRYDGPGTTALQTLTLQPSVTGQSVLELVYKRPFDTSPEITRHLSITLPETVSAIDLSDPNPVTDVNTQPSEDELSIQSDIEAASITSSTLPTSFDWRTYSKVTSVRDQGGCGSCWAFGTTAVMEAGLLINTNTNRDLSEQFLVSCGVAAKNSMCGSKYSCSGGCEDAQDYHVAYPLGDLGQYQTASPIANAYGAVLEEDFEYTAQDEDSGSPCPGNLSHAYTASQWKFVSSAGTPTVDQIKSAIYAYGPVTTRVCVSTNFYAYTGGVLSASDGSCGNHLVSIVGWEGATDSWIIKNSWGSDWGEGGYIRVPYGYSNTGNLSSYVLMPSTTSIPSGLSVNTSSSSIRPTFTWTPVSGAIGYRLRVSNVTTGMVDIEEAVLASSPECTPTLCTHTLVGSLKGINEKAEVALAGQSTFSTAVTFTTTNTPAVNDKVAGAIALTSGADPIWLDLGSNFIDNTEDPANVIAAGDLVSAWYSFTPSTTGVYTLNAWGSNFAPNLSVLKKVGTSRTLVEYGETGEYSEEYYYKLSFNAAGGTTYLIDVSSAEGGTLYLQIDPATCPSGDVCGVGVEGDGHVMRYPYVRIYDSNGNSQGYGYGEYDGFVDGTLYEDFAGPYKVYTYGNYSLAVTNSITTPIYSGSAYGLTGSLITVKNTDTEEISTDDIAVIGTTDAKIRYFFQGTTAGTAMRYYLPSGRYNFFASSSNAGLHVFRPNLSVPATILLDASSTALKRDTFTFTLEGIDHGEVYIFSPDYYGSYMFINSGEVTTVTYAAPAGTVVPHIGGTLYADVDDLNWQYSITLAESYGTVSPNGGVNHAYQIGGPITLSPEVVGSPLSLEDAAEYILAGATDAYDNFLDEVYYYGDDGSGAPAEESSNRSPLIEKMTTGKAIDGSDTHQFSSNAALARAGDDDLSTQAWVNMDVYPTYTLTDPEDHVSTLTPESNIFGNPAIFSLSMSSPIGTWHVSESVDLGPYGGVTTGATDFNVLPAPPGSDELNNPIVMTLDTPYSNSMSGAKISDPQGNTTLADPENVCNAADIAAGGASIWYSFTPTTAGIYTLNAYGSDFKPNLTVVKRVSATSRTPVICGDTDPYDLGYQDYYKLSFNAAAGSTYLISASAPNDDGNLSLSVHKETCASNELCGVGIEGDGRVMHWLSSYVFNSSGDMIGNGGGNFSGIDYVQLWDGVANGTYTVSTDGVYSFNKTTAAIPGTFAPSAVGTPKTLVTSKRSPSEEISTDQLVVTSSTNLNYYALLEGASAGSTRGYYLPTGTYNLSVGSDSDDLMIFKPNVNIPASTSTVTLDASTLAQDIFRFELDGITEVNASIITPDYDSHSFYLSGDRDITVAAPVGTVLHGVRYHYEKSEDDSIFWNYNFSSANGDITIVGGNTHEQQFGGEISLAPYANPNQVSSAIGGGYLYPGATDAHGNGLSSVYYYGETSASALHENKNEILAQAEKLSALTGEPVDIASLSNRSSSDLTDQDWVNEDIYPIYTVTVPGIGPFITTPEYDYFGNGAYFEIDSTSPLGTWEVTESVDLGPLGGEKEGTTTFEVVAPASNDKLTTPIPLTLDVSRGPDNTQGATVDGSQARAQL